ncbi:MAG: alpha/beta hydrolase [Pseudomonadota bacterium]
MQPEKILFLPGTGGNPNFWKPAGQLLNTGIPHRYFGWPGFEAMPDMHNIHSLNDLAARVAAEIEGPTAIVAQSMGGILSIRTALAFPDLITHLVLTATSGGIDVSSLGAQDWRNDFLEANPQAPRWFIEERTDYSAQLPDIRIPVQLIWGDADPISPVAVGKKLLDLLPNAKLDVIPGGAHDVAVTHAHQVANLIGTHLAINTYEARSAP